MIETSVTKSLRMYPRTLECAEKLQQMMRSPSFSDTVKNSIEICELVVSAIVNGERVVIEPKKGKPRQIILAGLNR